MMPRPPRTPRPASDAGTSSPAPSLADVAAGAASAATTPPPRGPGRPTKEASSRSSLAAQLADTYRGAGAMLSGAGLLAFAAPDSAATFQRIAAVGDALVANADACGAALAAWAERNPAVKRALTAMSSGSGLVMVIAAHAPIIRAAFAPTDPAGELAGAADLAGLVAGFMAGMSSDPTPPAP